MKIPAVMIYSRKTKLMFWATFKMDISPHQFNKHIAAAVAIAFLYVLWYSTVESQMKKVHTHVRGLLLRTRSNFMILHLIHTKTQQHLLSGKGVVLCVSNGISEVKWLCLCMCTLANSTHKCDVMRGSFTDIFRDECKINLLLFTKWYLLKKKRFCACVCKREREREIRAWNVDI